MRSLRRRAALGGIVWAVISMLFCGLALLQVFDAVAQRSFDKSLAQRHLQVVAALGNNVSTPEELTQYLNDPVYQTVYSGTYWQLQGPGGKIIASRSLFDGSIDPVDTAPEYSGLWVGEGPRGPVRAITEVVELEDGSRWRITVASSLTSLTAEREFMRQHILLALAFMGTFGIAAALLLTSAIVRPLTKLRDDVAQRWESGEGLSSEEYPSEVAPLIEDINALIYQNRTIIDRGRRQAADLAHALKTPSAALRNELLSLGESGATVSNAVDALDRIDAQMERSLARIRALNSSRASGISTDVSKSISRLARLFRSVPDCKHKTLNIIPPGELLVPMDRQDLEEVLGNILDNAFKWCRREVQLSALRDGNEALICVSDDGVGILEKDRKVVLASGKRLDTSMPGTGLGLAIANDLLNAYGGKLTLEDSDCGGLNVRITIPLGTPGTVRNGERRLDPKGMDGQRRKCVGQKRTPPLAGTTA